MVGCSDAQYTDSKIYTAVLQVMVCAVSALIDKSYSQFSVQMYICLSTVVFYLTWTGKCWANFDQIWQVGPS